MSPGGIGSTSSGSESVKRSPPTENSKSWRIRSARIGGPVRGIEPAWSRWVNGNEHVLATPSVMTGAPISSATSASSARASPWATASPAMISGFLAFASSSAARATAARSPTMRGATRVGAPRSRSRSAFRTSTGSERKTGPLGCENAVFTARCTMRGRSSSRRASVDHFTSGAAIGGRSDQRIGSVTLND